MNDYSTIEIDRDSVGVATLWLNRPEKNNAFNQRMIAELLEGLHALAADPGVRYMLLRGRGEHFSAGADLAWMQASACLPYDANLRDAQALGELMDLLYHLPFPTLAVVQGAAFGGAVGLVCCCDMAIGADDAVFSLSEVRIGLAPAVISPYVVQALGERISRRYALSAERFDGMRARDIGLLSEAYPLAQLQSAVEQWQATLAQNGPQAMRACKALLQEVGSGVLSATLREATEARIATLRVSEEGQEGLKAFLEKRRPAWL